jgi:hypothetical protein
VTSDKEKRGTPGIADKFKQSARGRLLWPGMTNALQIVASPIDAVPMHGVFDARECRFTLAFQLCDLDGHGVFRDGDQTRPLHPLAALLQPLALCRLWLFCCGFWPLCCGIDGRCLAADFGASAALDGSTVADGSFDASVRLLLMPACADAETRASEVIRMNLRMSVSCVSSRRLDRSILRLCELDHAGSDGTDASSAMLQTCFKLKKAGAANWIRSCEPVITNEI